MNYLVVTSIFPPTPAVRAFAELADWRVVVVGDKKTPAGWAHDGVTYLSPADQEALGFETARLLPWNHYGRKMLGYLYAMSRGATVIVDTDDDNIPKTTWSCPSFSGEFDLLEGEGFVNVYRHFTADRIWPRGFPLRLLRGGEAETSVRRSAVEIGIWQFLADDDPDVDAVYRLVFDQPVVFDERAPVVLGRGVVCPFNSQNTFFSKAAFPLMYLPSFVTFRFTDILRGLVAQPLLWENDLHLAFGPATVRQDRNPHDYLVDFADEIPMYLHTEAAFEATAAIARTQRPLGDSMRAAYEALAAKSIVEPREQALLDAWLADVAALSS